MDSDSPRRRNSDQIETSAPRTVPPYKSQAPTFRKPHILEDSVQFHDELAKLKSLVEKRRSKGPIARPIRKRDAPRPMASPRDPPHPGFSNLIPRGQPVYILFEFALGYYLFLARDIDDFERDLESGERYINQFDELLVLIAHQPFANPLVEMDALSKSIVTEELKKFLISKLPEIIVGQTRFSLVAMDGSLQIEIGRKTKIPCQGGHFYSNVIRGIRMNIDKLSGVESGDLKKAQLNLARRYSRQRSSSMYEENSMTASSSSFLGVEVVPHRFEGVFISKGKEEDVLCTKSLIPGKALHDEELICFQNEDGIEAEYRVWNPVRSKLVSAILSGVINIWIKPGSHVLCLGDVSGTTVSHLSDVVGHEGLVYAVGFSEAVVNIAEKRPNVIPIIDHIGFTYRYNVVIGMVDVMVAEASYSHEVTSVAVNALYYLKADPSSLGEALFASEGRSFKPMQLVTLKERDLYLCCCWGFPHA